MLLFILHLHDIFYFLIFWSLSSYWSFYTICTKFEIFSSKHRSFGIDRYYTYSASDNLTPTFLEFWLTDTWIFVYWRHQRALTRLENVRQLNIRRGKKLGFQLSYRHLLYIVNNIIEIIAEVSEFNLFFLWRIVSFSTKVIISLCLRLSEKSGFTVCQIFLLIFKSA